MGLFTEHKTNKGLTSGSVPLSNLEVVRVAQGNESISSFFEYSDANFLKLVFNYKFPKNSYVTKFSFNLLFYLTYYLYHFVFVYLPCKCYFVFSGYSQ